ncbi:uncharacterized protein LOC116853126 isoform X2 [Odontomachus brunneus]|uniref:uncharacterized protein LOC116853126 isoform X2 n=1 Tax=Odontomachus brunneus TaxID=486640 RepID=UPI0013F183F5|nr:uncharacterized protein LOC116853126 isoform X2 [Odontomachus brunneus]
MTKGRLFQPLGKLPNSSIMYLSLSNLKKKTKIDIWFKARSLIAINDNEAILIDIKENINNNLPRLQLENISIDARSIHIKVINSQDLLVKNMGNIDIREDNKLQSYLQSLQKINIIQDVTDSNMYEII